MRFAGWVSCALLVGCPKPHTPVSDFCSRYVNAVCARLAECRGGPADAWCSRLSAERLCREVEASHAASRIRFEAEYAEECFTILDGLPCRSLGGRTPAELDVLCNQAIIGLVPPMGTCFADRECGLDYHCDRSATRCPGVCRRLREVNESCDVLQGTRCNVGWSCIAGACAVAKKSGETCFESSDCEGGLSCDAFATPVSCQPERSSGPCRPGESDCAPRAACTVDTDGGTCAPAKQEGEACVMGRAECNDMLSCIGGTCVRWGKLGAECGELSPNERAGCLEGLCDAVASGARGTCVQRAAGAPCDLDVQCGAAGQCLGNPRVCVPRCGPQ